MDLQSFLSKASERVTAGQSFGPPVERGSTTIVPAAYVLQAGGGGGGEGPEADGGVGQGAGSGHFSVSWPIGAYVVQDDDVRWVPAVDATRIALAVVLVAKLAISLRGARRR